MTSSLNKTRPRIQWKYALGIDWPAVKHDVLNLHIHNWVYLDTRDNGDVWLECSRPNCSRKLDNGAYVKAKDATPDFLAWIKRNEEK